MTKPNGKVLAPENPFAGKPKAPTRAELGAVLGKTAPLWERAHDELRAELGLEGEEWNAFSKNSGWTLRMKRADRNIVYLVPRRGFFLASFALGAGAVKAAKASGLPSEALAILDSARRYAEGTAVAIPVRRVRDLDVVKKVAAAKLAN